MPQLSFTMVGKISMAIAYHKNAITKYTNASTNRVAYRRLTLVYFHIKQLIYKFQAPCLLTNGSKILFLKN